MKKLLLGLTLTGIILSGCSQEVIDSTSSTEKVERFTGMSGTFTITTDTKTGCKYIIYKSQIGNGATGGMTPLMKNKNEVDCGQ